MDTFQTLLETLRGLSPRELRTLAERAGVSVYTVAKIRSGETPNPGILTVEPLMRAVRESAPATPTESAA